MRRTETLNGAAQSSQDSGAISSDNNKFKISRIDNWDDLTEYSAAWAELELSLTSSTIFQTFEWHQSWWKAFGSDHELFVILCHKNGQLVGIAPMMITKATSSLHRRRSELRFIGCMNNSSDYLEFLVDPKAPNALNAILQHILDYLPQIDRVLLSHYPSHFESQQQTIDFFSTQNAKVIAEPYQEAPCRIMGNKQEDKRAASKSSLRRRYNYFNKSGDLRFHRCRTKTEALGYMDEFFDQHIARRDLTHSPSQFHDPAERIFYRELVSQMLSRGWLKFDVVLFDGKPIAFHFGFEYRNKFYWYKPTFDVQYAKRSPGEVLIKFLLEYAIEKDLEEFDFTVGSESFKYRFSNKIRYNNRLILFHSSIDYWLYRLRNLLTKIRNRISQYRAV